MRVRVLSFTHIAHAYKTTLTRRRGVEDEEEEEGAPRAYRFCATDNGSPERFDRQETENERQRGIHGRTFRVQMYVRRDTRASHAHRRTTRRVWVHLSEQTSE
jgi:hypothetical protein